jgi:hypothetical protein
MKFIYFFSSQSVQLFVEDMNGLQEESTYSNRFFEHFLDHPGVISSGFTQLGASVGVFGDSY